MWELLVSIFRLSCFYKPKGVLVSDEQGSEPLNFKTTLKMLFSASVCHSVFRLISVIFFDWQAINYGNSINKNCESGAH